MNKKECNRRNRKREAKIKAGKFGQNGHTYVDMEFSMKIGGKLAGRKRLHYGRRRCTSAFDLEQLAEIVLMWEQQLFQSTDFETVLQEAAQYLPSRLGLTPEQVFCRYWTDAAKTWEEEFNERNAGGGNENAWWGKEKDDYLRYITNEELYSFQLSPMPVKLAYIYGIFRGFYSKGGFDELRYDIENTPQYIKNIVDSIMTREEKK